MRLILATMGTLGDHLPLVGLGVELQRRGWVVRMACNPAMHGLVRRSGLEPLPLGEAVGPAEAQERPLAWDHWIQAPPQVVWTSAWRDRLVGRALALRALLQPSDVLLATRNLPLLHRIAEASGCRWVEVGLNSGSMIDYDTLALTQAEVHPWIRGLEALERELCDLWALPRAPSGGRLQAPLLRLHAVPPAFVPCDYPQLDAVHTGFWRYEDPAWRTWTPPAALAQAVMSPQAPLGLAFSSQPLLDPLLLLERHLQVAERLDTRLILVKGWAFRALDADAALLQHPALVALDAVPFSWLFPRLAVAFTHGGMGTLAAALSAGCRLVIEPFGNDQFLNARLALQQGLAIVVHPHRFDPLTVVQRLAVGGGASTDPRSPVAGPDHDQELGLVRAADSLCGVL